MKSSMASIRVIYVHREREKVDFKSREVNCLKECALALIKQNLTFQLQVNICSKDLLSIKCKAYSD